MANRIPPRLSINVFSRINEMNLAESVLEGNRLALARLLTQVENNTPEGQAVLNELFSHTGNAHLIGVTGASGTGKSSLVNQLARYFRSSAGSHSHAPIPQNEADQLSMGRPPRVGIVAVDPTSPFSGGAILGDRIRMRDLAGDSGVFIRSMATRGSLGGLATATSGVVQALDAAGFDVVLIETVGAGQAEVEIASLAHTTLVVEAPGLGDDIQAIKAGILEIADILVVNKADRPGVEATERALRSMLQLAHPAPRRLRHHGSLLSNDSSVSAAQDSPGTLADVGIWQPPIYRTVATEGAGIPELAQSISEHLHYLRESGEWNQRQRLRLQAELDLLLRETVITRWRSSLPEARYHQVLERLIERRISPRQAVSDLVNGVAQ